MSFVKLQSQRSQAQYERDLNNTLNQRYSRSHNLLMSLGLSQSQHPLFSVVCSQLFISNLSLSLNILDIQRERHFISKTENTRQTNTQKNVLSCCATKKLMYWKKLSLSLKSLNLNLSLKQTFRFCH